MRTSNRICACRVRFDVPCFRAAKLISDAGGTEPAKFNIRTDPFAIWTDPFAEYLYISIYYIYIYIYMSIYLFIYKGWAGDSVDRNFRDSIGIASHAHGNTVLSKIQYVYVTMFF